MKRLKHIVNWAIWSLIVLYAVLMVGTHVPAVQRWTGQKLAAVLARKLGTEVSIERVDVGFLNRLIVDGLLVKDQQRRNMLEVGRMSVRVDLLPLAEGRVVVSSAQLFGARAVLLRQDSLSKPNYQFVIDSLAAKDTTSASPLNLSINSLIIRRSSVSYNQTDKEPTPGIINPHHLFVSDISAHVILKYLTDDSVAVNVKRLALKERSGLTLSRLSLLAEKHPKGGRISKLFLQLPRSSLSIDSLVATCDFTRLNETLEYRADITDCSISPSDLTFLTPKVAMLKAPISVEGYVRGTASSIDVDRLQLFTVDGALKASLSGWWQQHDEKPRWYARIDRLEANEDCLHTVGKALDSLPAPLRHLTDIQLSGEASHHEDGNTSLHATATTNLGSATITADRSANNHYNGYIEAYNVDLGQLLENKDLGLLTTKADFDGDGDNLNAKTEVSHLDFKGNAYHNIIIEGTYSLKSGNVTGKLNIDNPLIAVDLEGSLTYTGRTNGRQLQTYGIKLKGDIARLRPKAMKLASQWGEATFSTTIDADITASNLNDADGTIGISRFAMRDSTTDYHISSLMLKAQTEGENRHLTLKGDMGEAELSGHFKLTTLAQSIQHIVAEQLPTLPGLAPDHETTSNVCRARLYLSDSQWLKHLTGVDLKIQRPLQLQATINDPAHKISIMGSMPQFVYNESLYENGNLHIVSPNDTMRCEASVARLSADSQHRMDFRLRATAANNVLNTTLQWDNNRIENHMSGTLNTSTDFYRNEAGNSEAHIHLLPSAIVMGNTQWDVEPGGVTYSANRIKADHVKATHNQQHIIIDGVASVSENDSITIDLNGVEVAYILDLVGFDAVSFAGEATGKAYVTEAFGTPKAWTKLDVEHFRFEGGRMGTLHAQAQWNQKLQQIDIQAVADDGPEAKTLIKGFVSPTHERIDLAIGGRGTYIDFLQKYTKSFLSNVTGHATGDVRLVGPLGKMDLLGQLVVDAQATVTTLGTTYTLSNDTVDFVRNDILLNHVTAQDIYQNKAVLSGGIHHDHLTDMTFDLNVSTDKLLAYDVRDKKGEAFYGTVIASGNVDIIGRPGEVTLNCTATPLDGSVFTYNAASPDAISDQSFIRWGERRDSSDRQNATATTVGQQEHSPSSTDLRMNFLLNTTPQATLRLLMDATTNDYITLAGEGVIRATYYDKGAFQMFGTYTVDHGTYGITIQNIIKKNFTFQPGGTIVFGGAPFDAALNLQAQYTVSGVSLSDLSIGNSFSNNTVRVVCLMNIGGQAGAPQVDFDLDMPTVNSEEKQMIRSVITSEQEMNQQVLYLLGIGRFYTQGTNNASTEQQYAQSQLAMQSFLSGTLSTQINELLSQVLKANNWNFGANITTGNEGWHNAEFEGMVSGRMLNNRLLINGQFGYRDNATQATPSFIGDFDIRYLLHPNGNLALKVYNQTNDRYFTRSSLNTQGIGFILKKDFNGLGDLFSHRRKAKKETKEKKE